MILKQATQPNPTSQPASTARPARIAALMVTWNRPDQAARVVEALARQTLPLDAIDLIVVDNASHADAATDLARRFAPEMIVANGTPDPAAPRFAPRDTRRRNTAGLASVTLIENTHNLGGCGGFNTAMRYALDRLDPDFLWLLDDDIDLADDSGAQLLAALQANLSIGIAGSRAVDIGDRATTFETTIYFLPSTGQMGPDPDPADPRAADHASWAQSVGGTRGDGDYHGVRDVDVASACSLMVRAADARQIGLWDDRFFLYCDDADWCLRFARAGKRVVLNLDAVVYHTPWFDKLTPERSYYAERNMIWAIARGAPSRTRRLIARRLASLLKRAIAARRAGDTLRAHLLLQTARDAATNRGGKLERRPPSGPLAFTRHLLATTLTCPRAILSPGSIAS